MSKEWRCFHCDAVFTNKLEAEEHFGLDIGAMPACRLSIEDVKQLRALEKLNTKLLHENEILENDARLWHESEADRVRRIGNHQWWFHIDCLEGEKIVLQMRVQELEKLIKDLEKMMRWHIFVTNTVLHRD